MTVTPRLRLVAALLATGTLGLAASPGASAPLPTSPQIDSLYALLFTRGPAWDTTRSAARQVGMREHSANLNRLRSEGRVILGGRYGDYGLILLRVRDRSDALTLLAPDSATAQGVFRAELSPWVTIYDGALPPR